MHNNIYKLVYNSSKLARKEIGAQGSLLSLLVSIGPPGVIEESYNHLDRVYNQFCIWTNQFDSSYCKFDCKFKFFPYNQIDCKLGIGPTFFAFTAQLKDHLIVRRLDCDWIGQMAENGIGDSGRVAPRTQS